MSNAAMRNGSNTVTNRYTDSKEKEDTEAIFPVPKKPVCNRAKKNKAIRASERASFRNEGLVLTACPFTPLTSVKGVSVVVVAILVSNSLQRTRDVKKVT